VNEEAVTFLCEGAELLGILHRAGANARDVGILIVVGGPQYRVGSHRAFVLLARRWCAAGYPVFRFDYRGMGDSSGDERTFEAVDMDIQSATGAFCNHVPGLRRVILFGLCDAASAVLMHCVRDGRVAGLILANPWVRTAAGSAKSYVRHYYGWRLLQRAFWRKLLAGDVKIVESVRGFINSWRLARNGSEHRVEAGAENFIDSMCGALSVYNGSVLVLISENDLTAQEFTDMCRDSPNWRKACARSNVSWSVIEGADHTLSTDRALQLATQRTNQWLDEINNR